MAAEGARIGLDNPALYGRFRPRPLLYRPPAVKRTLAQPRERKFDQQVWSRAADDRRAPEVTAPTPVWQQSLSPPARPEPVITPPPAANEAAPPVQVVPTPPALTAAPTAPAAPRQQRSSVLKRQLVHFPEHHHKRRPHMPRWSQYSKPQLALFGLAAVIVVAGLAVSWQTLRTNHSAAAQVAALSKRVDKQAGGTGQNSSVPSTTKPSAAAVSQYVVAPDLPRYLNIPKLGVHARVLQVGVTASGALGTPPDIYDTAWYTGSAKPGQPGATLIDGHVSSWTAHGVFYGLHTLAAGDRLQIVRGDGTVLNYQVVRTQVYNHNNVDMQAAMTPVTPGVSGLNLITCTGKVIKGTSQFNERVVVFAQQV